MKLIAHRGNLFGPQKELENKPEIINLVLLKNFDVEIDVWKIKSEFYLGHDEPQFKVSRDFLNKPGLWCHIKNNEAMEIISDKKINCFWHEEDKYTITSHGFIWAYPGSPMVSGMVVLCGENKPEDIDSAHGICSDYVGNFKI